MKKILFCFIFLVFCICFSSNAQIVSVLKNYSDSTAYWIDSGKKMLLNSLYQGDFEKAGELYDYLNESYGDGPYEVFSYQDALILNMFMDRWDTVQSFMLRFDDYNKNDLFYNPYYYNYYYRTSTYYNNFATKKLKLIPVAIGDVDYLRTSCIQSDIAQEAKYALELLFIYLKYQRVTMLYYTKLDEFYVNYPESPYEDFLNGFLSRPQLDIDWSWGLGGTVLFPQGDMVNRLDKPGVYPMMFISLTLYRLYMSGYIGGGTMELQQQLEISSPFEMTFDPGYEFLFTSTCLNLGYMMVKNGRIQLSPYASFGQLFLRSDEYDPPDEDFEYKLINSKTVGAGIHLDVRLVSFNKYNTKRKEDSLVPFSLSFYVDAGCNLITHTGNVISDGYYYHSSLGLLFRIGKY